MQFDHDNTEDLNSRSSISNSFGTQYVHIVSDCTYMYRNYR